MMMRMQEGLKKNKGFTLIELMIVVAIIGVLATLSLLSFLNYQCKTKQSEAKYHLGALRKNQEAYHTEYDQYSTELSRIGFAPKGTTRYTYSIVSATDFTFSAKAEGLENDVWTVDQDGTLVNVSNGCT